MLRRLLLAGMMLLTGALPVALAQVQPDQNLLMPEIGGDWKTLTTPHFRIHHEAAHADYAQNMAAIAERVHAKLSTWLQWQPRESTEIVILDSVDTSNGSATPLPYNRISIYLPAPVDGELMDQLPWLEMVFTHEYVHILHLDMADGVPLLLRNVFGRSMDMFTLFDFPQLFAPSWVTEGIAVYGESEYGGQNGNAASYGRLNSAHYEALMRMEVQRGLRSLTEVSFNSGFRWPYGQAYLYGAYFFKFAETRYGREAVARYIREYGSNLVPFRMDNRAVRIFGKSADLVWAEFQEYLTQRFSPQTHALRQTNLLQARPVYDGLYTNSALAAAADGGLYFLHDDASSRPRIMRLGVDGKRAAVLDGTGVVEIDWHAESGLLLSKYAICDNTNVYADLYQWTPGMLSARRLTHCGRYTFASWRPDGRAIAAIQRNGGSSRMILLDTAGKILTVLSDLPKGDTLGQIAWSPDGNTLVASIQRQKSGWNLELFDVGSHHWQALTSNRDLVQRPRFSADGREIYFLSDHEKVWNLRRLVLGVNKIETLSHTASTVAEAVVMPDKSYRLVEYTPYGKAITALDALLVPDFSSYAARTERLAEIDSISNSADFKAQAYADVKDYSPWRSLKPHYWFPLIDSSAGLTSYAGIMLSGSDALSFHKWSAIPLYYYDQKEFGGVAAYSFYNKVTLSAQRQFVISGNHPPELGYRDEEVRYQALLHHSFNATDSALYVAGAVASEEIASKPYPGTGQELRSGNKLAGAILQYDNSRFYKRSIAPVDGRRVQFLSESYDLLGGSIFSGKTSRLDWNEYISLGGNHALSLRGLYAQGDRGIRPYRMGGTSELLSMIGGGTGLGRRDFPLRGYPSGLASLSGSNMVLLTAEWKIPLGYHYDGWFVPPLGIGRESVTLFVERGDAWNQDEPIGLKTGAGMELNVEVLPGYDLLKVATMLGYAEGLDKGGEKRIYFRMALPLF